MQDLNINDKDKKTLFRIVKHSLGEPLVKIELEDETLNDLLLISIMDYVELIQNWLIVHQWTSLVGVNVNETDLAKAFITRSLDYEMSFTYAYSKIVGLQTNGPWELKQDFVELEQGKQYYIIPKNREVNEVLWITPPAINQAVIDPYLGAYSNAFGSEYAGLANAFVMPAFDILLRAQDRNLKSRILRSELIYRITAGADGTKILHLAPYPGSRFDFNTSKLNGMRCWYWYYETNGNRDECLKANKDIVKLPSDVPVETLGYSDLNEPAKNWVRRYFTAKCKETLGLIRGTYSGSIKIGKTDVNLDYNMLLSQGKEEIEKLKTELEKLMEELTTNKTLEKKANEAENLNKILKHTAFDNPFTFI